MAQSDNASIWNNSELLSSVHNIQRRHISFVYNNELASCYVNDFNQDYETLCDFIKHTPSCNSIASRFNYLKFLVCAVKIDGSTPGLMALFAIFLMIVLFLIAFMFLVTKHFILPNVIHVARYIHMPLYDFGVTIISVMMSSQEVAWIIKDCNYISKNGSLLLANMMGAIFTTFTIGLSVVCLGQHTKIPGGEVIMHIIISIVALAFSHALIISRFYGSFQEGIVETVFDLNTAALLFVICYVTFLVYIILTKRRRNRRSSIHGSLLHGSSKIESHGGWSQLWHALNPFEHMKAPRLIIAIFVPIWLIAALQIPVIDKNRQMFGWCKYLTCLNIFIFPWLMYFGKFGGVKIVFIVLLISSIVILIVTVFCTKVDEIPKYQGFYAVTGIILGCNSYYLVQDELETILWQSFSYIFSVPRDIIMLSAYVFHNILNLVIFCYELVVMGFGNLACGVVIGVVLNKIFLMLPILEFHDCNDNLNVLGVSANTTTCFVFTILTFVISILCISLTDFKLRISQGVFLISVYCLFLFYMILSGFFVMHPYGAYHLSGMDTKARISDWA